MRVEVVLSGGYAWLFMHSVENVCDMVVSSDSVLNGAVKGHEIVLPYPQFLAVQCSLHEAEQGFVICQNYKLVSSQLCFKKV